MQKPGQRWPNSLGLSRQGPIDGYRESYSKGGRGLAAAPFQKTLVLVGGADLHGLHAGFGFGPGLERAVVHYGRGRGRRLGVNDGALLGGAVANDVEFGGVRRLRDARRREYHCANHQNLFQGVLLLFHDAKSKPAEKPIVPLLPEIIRAAAGRKKPLKSERLQTVSRFPR